MAFRKIPGLTQPQAEVVLAIIKFVEEHGYQPSLGQLGEILGGITVKSVRDRLVQCAEKGVVIFPPRKSERCYRLVGVKFKAVLTDEPVPAPDPASLPTRLTPHIETLVEAMTEYFAATDNEPAAVNDIAAYLGVNPAKLYEVLSAAPEGTFERVGTKYLLLSDNNQE